MSDQKSLKVAELQAAGPILQYVAARLGTVQQTPADPSDQSPTLQALTSEAWQVTQNLMAAVHAGIEANTGSIWADPTDVLPSPEVLSSYASKVLGAFPQVAQFLPGLAGWLAKVLLQTTPIPSTISPTLTTSPALAPKT